MTTVETVLIWIMNVCFAIYFIMSLILMWFKRDDD